MRTFSGDQRAASARTTPTDRQRLSPTQQWSRSTKVSQSGMRPLNFLTRVSHSGKNCSFTMLGKVANFGQIQSHNITLTPTNVQLGKGIMCCKLTSDCSFYKALPESSFLVTTASLSLIVLDSFRSKPTTTSGSSSTRLTYFSKSTNW